MKWNYPRPTGGSQIGSTTFPDSDGPCSIIGGQTGDTESSGEPNSKMTHTTAGISSMQHPTKSQITARIDNPRNVSHNYLLLGASFLDGKLLDFDMPSIHSWPVFVDHHNDSSIIDIQRGQTFLQGIKFFNNITEILGGLGTSNSSIELGLNQAGGDNRLDTTFPCDSCTAQKQVITDWFQQ